MRNIFVHAHDTSNVEVMKALRESPEDDPWIEADSETLALRIHKMAEEKASRDMEIKKCTEEAASARRELTQVMTDRYHDSKS